MKDDDNSLTAKERHALTFRIGLVGSIVLSLSSLVVGVETALVGLAVWAAFSMFVLPVAVRKFTGPIRFSKPGRRGPHQ